MTKSSENIIQEQPVIFLHIPKAAGTTLNKIIERQYEPTGIFSIGGSRTEESVEEFKKLPEAQRKEIRVLKGHMGFGLHEFLPYQRAYITILRDPVDRIISHYYFVLRSPNHYLYKEVTSRNMTLKEYVSSGISKEMDNGQTRLLAGVDGVAVDCDFGSCSNVVLENAKKNLQEHFAVVGISERFDETLILLKRTFGWRSFPFYTKQNVTRKRPLKEDISRETLKTIEKYNGLDIELYKYAKEMFDELISQQSHSFKIELKVFNLLNNYHGKVHPLYYSAIHKIKALVRNYLLK